MAWYDLDKHYDANDLSHVYNSAAINMMALWAARHWSIWLLLWIPIWAGYFVLYRELWVERHQELEKTKKDIATKLSGLLVYLIWPTELLTKFLAGRIVLT